MNDQKISPIEKPAIVLTKKLRAAHRILVAEDDKDIRRLNAEALAYSGYHVHAVEDGAIAWETLQQHDYDLLVTDNEMPTLSGVELLHKLRGARKSLPVIVATGTLPLNEFSRSPWLHPAVLLPKPYTIDELLGVVQEVLLANYGNEGKPDSPTDLPSKGLDLI